MPAARVPVKLTDSRVDLVMKLAEGNPGAITVIGKILEADPQMGLLDLLNLDDMNMRGGQIWAGYKDHCKEDIGAFMEAMRSRDPAMVETVNSRSGSEYTAVTHGGAPRERDGFGLD